MIKFPFDIRISSVMNGTFSVIVNFKKLSHSFIILYFTALFLLAGSGCTQNTEKKEVTKPFPCPSWFHDYPLVLVLNHDDIAIFRRRVGGNPLWQEDESKKEMTEGTIQKLKETGVTMALIPFYKGFGLEAEKEYIQTSKQFAELCRKYGIKVGVYVGSTVGYETFLLEKPEAEEWFVPDFLGSPVRYNGTQTFRKRVYFMHPGFIEYMKQVVRIAIEDLKVDLIHFDNTSNRAQPPIFFHPMAIEDFKTFLMSRYTPELLKKRFGFSDMRYIEPPKFNKPLSTIDDPLFQEWTDFRCQQLADFYGIMGNYIHSLNPEVVVENNPHSGLSGNNTMWDQGIDYPRLLSHTDIVWTEEGQEVKSSVNEDGILISKIRTYKMARTLNNRVFNHTGGRILEMAEAIAYNRQGMGSVGGLSSGDNLPREQKNYIEFFHKNFNYYRDIVNIADIAVLHSYATMAYNNDRPYQSTFLFEQALIQEKIPFDIIFDDNLKDLKKYKVLVLADQECLNDEKLELIRSFVNQGGGLVATEHTSLFNEWRQRRSEFGLNDLFLVKAPEWQESGKEDILKIAIQRNLYREGRVVYIPEIQPSIPKPPTVAMSGRYWKLPVNLKDLIESVKWASGNSLSLNIEAPLSVTMELIQKEDKGALILHLLNYDSGTPSVKNIKVDVQVPGGKKVTQVTVLTPDGRSDEIVQFIEKGNRILFIVPKLMVYDMVVMKLE
jgi:hypothetical protein